MADRTSAGYFGDMFRMLGHRKVLTKDQRGLARFLWESSKDYDFEPYQMQADASRKKLRLVGDDEEGIEDKDYGPVLSPKSAFRGMVKLYSGDIPDAENWKKEELRKNIEKLASYAKSFGIAPSEIGATSGKSSAEVRRASSVGVSAGRPAAGLAVRPSAKPSGVESFYEQIFPGGITPVQAGAMVLGFGAFIYVVSRWASPTPSP